MKIPHVEFFVALIHYYTVLHFNQRYTRNLTAYVNLDFTSLWSFTFQPFQSIILVFDTRLKLISLNLLLLMLLFYNFSFGRAVMHFLYSITFT